MCKINYYISDEILETFSVLNCILGYLSSNSLIKSFSRSDEDV